MIVFVAHDTANAPAIKIQTARETQVQSFLAAERKLDARIAIGTANWHDYRDAAVAATRIE